MMSEHSEEEIDFEDDLSRLLIPPAHPEREVHILVSDRPRKTPARDQSEQSPRRSKEDKLVDLVRSGDVAKVAEFLRQNHGHHDLINAVHSSTGESALSVAMCRGDEEMVRFLTTVPGLKVSDNVLLGCQKGFQRIVSILLDFVVWSVGADAEYEGCSASHRFPLHATPLSVAAGEGHFRLVRMLEARGHKIHEPHPIECHCKECRLHCRPDLSLEYDLRRLHTYKALSNPAHILVTAHDPILRAFQLHQEIIRCAQSSTNRNTYLALAEDLAKFPKELIALCRTSDEVNVILSRKTDGQGEKTGREVFPRLQLAMDHEQKEFVAHPYVQHVLSTKWVGDSPSWTTTPTWEAVLHLLARLVVLPFLALLLIVAPFASLTNRLASPVNRLVSYLASYLVFLVLITIQGHASKNNTGRTTTGLEPVIAIFLLGRELSLARMLFLKGFTRFFRQMWNIYDLLMVHLLWSWFSFWYLSSYYACSERKFWRSLHPVLISESLLAIGTIVAYGRVLFLCQLHRKIGPMQVSLSKMFADVAQCSLIFIAIIISFSAGVGGLYQYYDGMSENEAGYKVVQPPSFTSFVDSLRFFFWGVFALSPPEYTTVVLEGSPSGEVHQHHFTQAVGTICFAAYMLLVNVMLLNVLVAKMTNTYKRVTGNVELEWTFGKTEVILDFMHQTVLPPPLNLIPTSRALVWLYRSMCGRNRAKKHMELAMYEDQAYFQLMSKLESRYMARKQENAPTELTTPPKPPAPVEPPKLNPEVLAMSVSSSVAEHFDRVFASIQKELSETRAEAAQVIDACMIRLDKK